MIDFEHISFSHEKSTMLRQERGIGFEEVLFVAEHGGLLDIIDHPSPQYPHQRIMIVDVDGYAVAVPYVLNEQGMFLKTLYPSRDYTKYYGLTGEQDD